VPKVVNHEKRIYYFNVIIYILPFYPVSGQVESFENNTRSHAGKSVYGIYQIFLSDYWEVINF
jgi:hypothetical protein